MMGEFRAWGDIYRYRLRSYDADKQITADSRQPEALALAVWRVLGVRRRVSAGVQNPVFGCLLKLWRIVACFGFFIQVIQKGNFFVCYVCFGSNVRAHSLESHHHC